MLRAQELAAEHEAAKEILDFLLHVMRLQEEIQLFIQKTTNTGRQTFADPIAPELAARFPPFLTTMEEYGPAGIAHEAQQLRRRSAADCCELLNAFWMRPETTNALQGQQEFFARAFLQPYAEIVRIQSGKQRQEWTPRLCPFCLRKPASGVLRPLGDGGQRCLVCSFCLGEWAFRRIVCAGCGEENETRLPVYTAHEFEHVRVECCDSCRSYMKTVDLTRNGLADPVVDEIASVALDLWAEQKGYSKLQTNLMLL